MRLMTVSAHLSCHLFVHDVHPPVHYFQSPLNKVDTGRSPRIYCRHCRLDFFDSVGVGKGHLVVARDQHPVGQPGVELVEELWVLAIL